MSGLPTPPGRELASARHDTTAPAPGGRPQAAWPAWSAWAALVTVIAAAAFAGVVLGVLAALAGASLRTPPPGVTIGATFVQDVAFVAVPVLFAGMVARPRAELFGLRRVALGPAIGWLAATWIGFLVFSALYVSLAGVRDHDALPKELGADRSTLALAAVTLLVCVFAPIAEEIFFRGYFFTALRNARWPSARWSSTPWPAAVVTGIVFGAIHALGTTKLALVPILMAFGFALCVLYVRTGSLVPSMCLHALNNALALGVGERWGWEIPIVMVGAVGTICAGSAVVLRRSAPRGAQLTPRTG